ncbi:MAG TPA: rhomboid family intramembrane serine protease [Trebonia sp.]
MVRHRRDGRTVNLGASGAIATVLGAYFVLYPGSKVTTWIFPIFAFRIPAWIYLGLWFLYQLIEANFGLFKASANGGGVAFFAHVGGFIIGLLVTGLLPGRGEPHPESDGSLARKHLAGPASSRQVGSPRLAACRLPPAVTGAAGGLKGVQGRLAAAEEAGRRRRRCASIFCHIQSILLLAINIEIDA